MEAAIREQVGNAQPEEVMELSLDLCSPVDMSKLATYTSLRNLSLADNKLTSLEDLPELEELIMLDLSGNKLTNGFEHITEKFNNLTHLDLSNNPIESVDDLICLSNLKYLESLSLEGCPVVDNDNYRDTLFPKFECLVSIDGLDCHGEEVDSSESEFDDSDDEEESDTGLEVLLGEDIPSELDDSEFQMDDSAVKEAQSLNESSGVGDESVEISTSESKSITEETAEKRSLNGDVVASPSKKPKV